MPTMTPAEQLVLSKLYTSKKEADSIRDQVEPGTYQGEMVLRIPYALTVGEDYESAVAASVPWQQIACALLSSVNPATRAALVRNAVAGTLPDGLESYKAEAVAAVKSIVEDKRRTCRGKVKVIASPALVTGAAVESKQERMAS